MRTKILTAIFLTIAFINLSNAQDAVRWTFKIKFKVDVKSIDSCLTGNYIFEDFELFLNEPLNFQNYYGCNIEFDSSTNEYILQLNYHCVSCGYEFKEPVELYIKVNLKGKYYSQTKFSSWIPIYFEKLQSPDFREDIEDESYSIEFLSNSILCISIVNSMCPYHGTHCMSSFQSICYDLKTAKKLEFKDFFSIDKNKLIQVLIDKGYYLESTDVGEPTKYQKIYPTDEYIEPNIKDLFTVGMNNNGCIEFYFKKLDGKTELIFNFQCAGPQLIECGISLEYLKPYLVKYFK